MSNLFIEIVTHVVLLSSMVECTIVIPEYNIGIDTFITDQEQLFILQSGTTAFRYVDRYQTFLVPFSQIPQVVMSIYGINAGLQGLLGFEIISNQVSQIGFNIRYMALSNTPVSALWVQYLAVVDEQIQIASTTITESISSDVRKTKDFHKPFTSEPYIALFVYGFNLMSISSSPNGVSDSQIQIVSTDPNQYQFTIYSNGCEFNYFSIAIIAGPSNYFRADYLEYLELGSQSLTTIDQKTQVFQLGIIGVQYNISPSQSGALRIQTARSTNSCCDINQDTTQLGDTQINIYRLSYFYYMPCALYCDYCPNINSVTQCNLCDVSTQRIIPPLCTCPYGYYSLYTEINCIACLNYCSGCQQSSSHCTTCNLVTLRLIPPFCLACPNNMFIDQLLINCQNCDLYCNGCTVKSSNCITCSIDSQRIDPPQCNTCQNGFYSIIGIVNCSSCPDNCQLCQNESGSCIQCISNNFYLDNGKCLKCPIQCNTCNAQNCLTINLCQLPCVTCDENNQCLTCMSEDYQILNGQCLYCPSICIACNSIGSCITAPLHCLKGVANGSKIQCSLCSDNYYIQHDFCVKCSTECLTCTFEYRNCNLCRFPELKSSSCQLCEAYSGIYSNYNSNTCYTICGDGIIARTEECDDGNDSLSDGCANCIVQDGYICYGSICELIIYPVPVLQQVIQNDSAYTSQKSILLTYNTPINNQNLEIQLFITNNISFNYGFRYINSQTFMIDVNLQEQCLDSVLQLKFSEKVQSSQGFIQQVTTVECFLSDYIILNIIEQAIVEKTDTTMFYLMIVLLIFVSLGVVFGGLHVFWNLLDILQTMSYLKYVNTIKPLFLQQFFELFGFLQFQNLPINRLIDRDNIISLINYQQISQLPLYITLDGYNTCTITNIIPIFNVFIAGYLVYNGSRLLLRFVMYFDTNCLMEAFSNKISVLRVILNLRQGLISLLDNICTQWFWSGIIRVFMSSSFDISFIIVLGLFGMEFQEISLQIILNDFLTGILFFGFIGICFKLTIIIGFQIPTSKSSKQESLYESLRLQKYAKYYNIFLLYKKLLFMLALILLYNLPLYQILTIVLLQITQLLYLYLIDPIKNQLEGLKQKISETLMLIAEIQLTILIFDDFSGLITYDQRKTIGWLSVFSYSMIIVTQLLMDVLQQIKEYEKKYVFVRNSIKAVTCRLNERSKRE